MSGFEQVMSAEQRMAWERARLNSYPGLLEQLREEHTRLLADLRRGHAPEIADLLKDHIDFIEEQMEVVRGKMREAIGL